MIACRPVCAFTRRATASRHAARPRGWCPHLRSAPVRLGAARPGSRVIGGRPATAAQGSRRRKSRRHDPRGRGLGDDLVNAGRSPIPCDCARPGEGLRDRRRPAAPPARVRAAAGRLSFIEPRRVERKTEAPPQPPSPDPGWLRGSDMPMTFDTSTTSREGQRADERSHARHPRPRPQPTCRRSLAARRLQRPTGRGAYTVATASGRSGAEAGHHPRGRDSCPRARRRASKNRDRAARREQSHREKPSRPASDVEELHGDLSTNRSVAEVAARLRGVER